MIVELIAVCLLAKLKRFRLRYLFATWTFYPILAMQVIAVVFQASIFFRDYQFVPLIPYLEPAIMVSFLFAVVLFQLYRPAMVGSALVVAGTLLNRLVMAQNGGHMPVFPTLSYWTGYVTPAMFTTVQSVHVLGDANTKLMFLADVVDYGYSILSVGDVFIHLYVCVLLYALIKAVNLRFGTRTAEQHLKEE